VVPRKSFGVHLQGHGVEHLFGVRFKTPITSVTPFTLGVVLASDDGTAVIVVVAVEFVEFVGDRLLLAAMLLAPMLLAPILPPVVEQHRFGDD